MSSPVGGKNNVKIFVLYLMHNINYPLDFITLNDVVMQTDYVMYIDLAESFHEMLDDGLIEAVGEDIEGQTLYVVTKKGQLVASELKSDILDSILDQSLTCALRFLNFRKRGIKISSSCEKLDNGKYLVSFLITENDVVLLQTSLTVDSENRAERMRQNFRERPEAIYKGTTALLAGNVNFLFS